MDHGTRAAIPQTQGIICHKVTACSLTPSAEDAPVVIHEKVFACSIYRETFCVGRIGPVIDAVPVPQILQFAVSTHLAVHAVMISF
jgi:hypothetical protein